MVGDRECRRYTVGGQMAVLSLELRTQCCGGPCQQSLGFSCLWVDQLIPIPEFSGMEQPTGTPIPATSVEGVEV